MRSQAKHRAFLDRLSARVQPKVDIPAENSWGKAMPQCRVRNMTHEWYAKQVGNLLPPLPESEWEELRSRATGEVVWQGPAKRRIRRQTGLGVDSSAPMESVLLEGPPKGHTFGEYIHGRPHTITPRVMRKLWALIFRHVPVFSWNESRKMWTVQWGDAEKDPRLITAPSSPRDALLFSNH